MLARCLLLVVSCWFVSLAGAGCAEAEQHERLEAHEATLDRYEQALAALDTLRAPLAPVDSFFLDYDPALFAPFAFDSLAAARWVDSTLAALSRDEKIGQLFIVHLPRQSLRTLVDDAAHKLVEDYHVGGFLVPRLLGPEAVHRATQRLQRRARVPLFFAADYERGVGRFNNTFTELPSNMALGATRDTVLAAAAGRISALESRAIGINLLFAPVVDVNNNPDNPIINIRSYGEDPALVGDMATAFVRAAQAYGVLTTLKHFPGHGNTTVDSHARMGTIHGSRAALEAVELRPYRRVLGAVQPAGVMSAHLWIEALDARPLPATFSTAALTALLRDSLGFDGFVVTDDIRMGALENTYPLRERIVRPLLAGADVILTPDDLVAAQAAVRQALADGRLSEARLDASVRRILWAKARAGLYATRQAGQAPLRFLLERPHGAYLAQTIADRAVTLLKTHAALPLDSERRHVALVQLTNQRDAQSIEAAMAQLADLLGGRLAADVRLDRDPTARRAADVLAETAAADVIVVALYMRLTAGRGTAGLFAQQHRLVERLLAQGKPLVLVTFGNPYAVTPFARAEVHVVAYDQALETVRAVARILTGAQPPRGRLPITVAPYDFGAGRSTL